MKGLILLFAICLAGFKTYSQGVLGFPEYNVLYRGFDNKLQLGDIQNKNPYVLSASKDVSLSLTDSANHIYSARVSGTSKEATILILTHNLRDTIGYYKYRIRNLPPPDLYLGNTIDGGTTRLDTIIQCKYGDDLIAPTSAVFEVITYEIIAAGASKTVKGKGGILSQEAREFLIEVLNKPREDECITITIQTTVKGPDGVSRKKSGSYKLK